MKTNLDGVITDSKFMFDKREGFLMYVDVKTGPSTGFAKCFKEPNSIRKLLKLTRFGTTSNKRTNYPLHTTQFLGLVLIPTEHNSIN